MFGQFGAFLLLCGLVSIILTNIFMGSEVGLERCDSYGNFGYLKTSKMIILREFCEGTHCPAIGTLALLLFLTFFVSMQEMYMCQLTVVA